MLEKCPYDGEMIFEGQIDVKKLAYDGVLYSGQRFDEIKKVLGNEVPYFHVGIDERLKDAYMDNSIHYMLWEGNEYRKSGLEQLLEEIDKTNEMLKDIQFGSYYEEGAFNLDSLMLEYEEDEETGCYIISYARESKKGKVPIMKLFPCCPNCHMKLADNWKTADDVVLIGITGLEDSGKTCFEDSLIANRCEALKYLNPDWTILPAHETLPGMDYHYTQRVEEAELMARKGICPEATATEKKTSPLCLSVYHKGKNKIHHLSVVLFDNPGEVLKTMSPMDVRLLQLSQMDAFIYLIEPSQMAVNLNKEEDVFLAAEKKDMELLTVKEQAKYQQEHKYESAVGEDILKAAGVIRAENTKTVQKEDPFRMLTDFEGLMFQRFGKKASEKMKKQHVCLTVAKCDQLEGIPEMKNIPNSDYLFLREDAEDLFSLQARRDEITEKLFDEYVYKNSKQKSRVEEMMGSVSYHCISALGCGTERRMEGNVEAVYLKGEHAPIRVAEPLAAIIMKKIIENGWYEA